MATPGQIVGVGKLITPGGQQGPKGDAGTAANVPLADITQNGLLRKTSGNTTDFVDGTNNYQPLAPVIWSARLRSFNAIGNPNFEVDQRLSGGSAAITNGMIDRWLSIKTGMASATGTIQQIAASLPDLCVPGTSFRISRSFLRITLTAQQTSLATGDQLYLHQEIEGINWRELSMDVHSISLLVRSSVAGLKFSMVLRDPVTVTQSLVKLCTIPTANVWTLITLLNLPIWPTGNFQPMPGSTGYRISICLAAGANQIASAADTWQSGNFIGAPGMSNFAASPVNSTFDIAFVQHEPGPQCTTLQDKPFTQNLDECLRYYCKSYDYGVKPGTVSSNALVQITSQASQAPYVYVPFPKRMAKAPTLTIYSPITGTVNAVRDTNPGTDRGVSGIAGLGEASYSGMGLNSYNTVATNYQWQHTADTGW